MKTSLTNFAQHIRVSSSNFESFKTDSRSFHFIFNSLYRVKTSITKVTALQLALSIKQKPIYNFMSQLTYKKKYRVKVKEYMESILRDSFLKSRKATRSFGFGS